MRLKKKYLIIVIFLVGLLALVNNAANKGINSVDSLYWFLMNRYSDNEIVYKYLSEKYPVCEKFWLHRTNTPAKLMTKGVRYAGVELDVTYYSGVNDFDNSHDMANSIEWPLDKMFEILGDTQQKIWLDYKNLTFENAVASRKRLEELLLVHGIAKNRCIVESHNYQQLKEFHDHGFYTSFYVPTSYAHGKAEIPGSEERFKEILTTAAATGNIDAVSFPYEFYEEVKKTGINKEMLCWDNNSKWYMFYAEPKRNAIMRDDRVKVILVKDISTAEH